ncbi:copper amine oxidase N-terminal domain-containing protein [Desulfoscipio geothermicus]|uniref:Copper amine oxidase N-terminal domain-containing protein n=1 Tax=Desulfoscipio geothermicus DSM 3669 TaxID=1121426 RepID=A0A1I6DNC3_9FIRM|nr:copper amine oxidase N-terminal domain-containing protein [Desulfoscipio geothermicus]SFR06939.1 Copper amine oxidase N-terminal domain-containing protein [Desulfoscipio geothermicus DSM 3669]
MKKFILFVVIVALMVIFVPGLRPADAADNHSVIFTIDSSTYQLDDQLKEMDAKPFIEDGRTYVPVRYMSEPFGIKVEWNKFLRLVTLTRDDTGVYLVVGVKKILVRNGEDNAVDIAKKIISEGSDLDVAPVIRDGRTYLPARWVAEAFGYAVKWDDKTRTVAIVPQGAKTPEVILPPVEEIPQNTVFKRPDIEFPEKPRAMIMGFMPSSKKVVFWNYDPALVVHGSSGDYYVTVDGGEPRRWEETLPDYLTPEPRNRFDEGPINIKVLLTAFGAPEEAFQYDPKSKTLRIYGAEGYWSPGYVELKDGGDTAKLVWEKDGHVVEDSLNGKFYVKNGKYFIDGNPNAVLLSAFNFNAAASIGPPEPPLYENLWFVSFNKI